MPLHSDHRTGDQRRPGWRRLGARLGLFSPFATLATFSPAARLLLGRAERNAERALHLVRLCVWSVAMTAGFFLFRIADLFSAPLLLAFTGLFTTLWVLIWRHLSRENPSVGFRCALILFDGYMVDRGILLFQNPAGLFTSISPDLYAAVVARISRADVGAITPPMLVFLALTGAFRLDPRLALLSTPSGRCAPAGRCWRRSTCSTPHGRTGRRCASASPSIAARHWSGRSGRRVGANTR